MKSKFLTAIIAITAALCCAFGFAACGGDGDGDGNVVDLTPTEGLEYTLSDKGNSYICSGMGEATKTDIVIASEYNGKPVTEIGEEAFKDCSNLTSVIIPDSVTTIYSRAFWECSKLMSLTIPDRESISDLHPTNSY